MFFWQAAEEVEELDYAKKVNKSIRTIKELRIDTFIGMLFSIVGSWFVVVTTATVLNKNGITNINTAADAAKALEPLVQTFPNAGVIAKAIELGEFAEAKRHLGWFKEIIRHYEEIMEKNPDDYKRLYLWNDEGIDNAMRWKYGYTNHLPLSNFDTSSYDGDGGQTQNQLSDFYIHPISLVHNLNLQFFF